MMEPTMPADEAERIADVRALDLLDTPPEDRFDRIVLLAGTIFQVPISYIAIIDDDRQWFKASRGLPVVQTQRNISFCGHTILRVEPLIVPDATKDDRFADNPMVTGEQHIRFYAGHPLRGPSGKNVATICLMDREPRTFSDHDVKLLTQLAELAERELTLVDLIQSQRDLIVARRSLAAAQSQLANEISDAAAYIESLLPPRLSGAVRSDYRFIASSHLGGDLFGYQWLGEDELAVYLLDVMGHGVGSSLLAVTASDSIRRQTLADADFADPASVLCAMNLAFPIEQNHNKFFTIWYGVYNTKSRELRYSSAGHHPALMFKPDGSQPSRLGEPAHMIGLDPDETFETRVAKMPDRSRLYLFSDAAFEMTNADGQMLGLDGLANELIEIAICDDCRVEQAVEKLVHYRGKGEFDDDLSIIELEFLS